MKARPKAALVSAGALVASVAALTATAAPTPSAGSAATATGATIAPKFDPKIAALLPARIKKSKKVTYGALWETPPIISIDPKNPKLPIGAAVDLGKAVSTVLGVKPVFKNMQWPAQLPGLQAGTVDVLWGQVTDTAEREQSIADLISWRQDPLSMLVAAGNPKGVTSLANACGLKIAVPTGSTQELIVKGNSDTACASNPIEAVAYPGAKEAVVAVKAGTVDGWIDGSPSIADIVKQAPSDFSLVAIPNAQVTPYASNIAGIAIGKKQPGLTRAITAALKKIAVPNGAYPAIMKKWGMASGSLKPKAIKINGFTGTPAGKTK
ncbi:MAG: transporter substrate-binding domain-containing protein [Gaiellales bacterium]